MTTVPFLITATSTTISSPTMSVDMVNAHVALWGAVKGRKLGGFEQVGNHL